MWKVNFWYHELFIQCNKDSCYEHTTVSVNIYLHGCVSLLTLQSVLCGIFFMKLNIDIFFFSIPKNCKTLIWNVGVWSNPSTSKKVHHVSELSKLDTLFHKTCIKVLRLNMCTFMISLSKIAHQMQQDHPFSQRNKTTEWAVRVVVGGNREGGLDKVWKRVGCR